MERNMPIINIGPPEELGEYTPSGLMCNFVSLGNWTDENFAYEISLYTPNKECSIQTIRKWKNSNVTPTKIRYAFFAVIENHCEKEVADDWNKAFITVWAGHKGRQKNKPASYPSKKIAGKQKKKTALFENISRCNDFSLPYYSTSNQNTFFEVHLEILQELLGEKYEQFHSKLLRETVDGKEILFPAINLLESKNTLTISQEYKLGDVSHTIIPKEFTTAVKNFMPNVEDNYTYTLKSLNKDTNEISCAVSSYLKTLYACDRWYYEMITNFSLDTVKQKKYRKNRFLKTWAQQLEDNVIGNTFAPDQSLGGACLCLYKTDNGYEYLLGQKSTVANAFKELHVLPSFMFQPLSENHLKFKNELSIEVKVLQELAEEIFKYDEFEADGHGRFLFEGIYSTPQNAELLKLLKDGRAELHITGLWLDMYRLRPEITTVLIIKDKKWFEKFFTPETKLGNWEILKRGVLDIAADKDSYEHILSGHNGRLCPPGAAALISGMQLFNQLPLK